MSSHKTEFVLAVKDPKEITSIYLSEEERNKILTMKDRNPNRKPITDRPSLDPLVREKAALLVEELYKEQLAYNEFLIDARRSAKLNEWETNFIQSLWNGFQRGSLIRFEDLTPKMLEAAKKIRRKIYDVG